MYFFSINTITSVKAYKDTAEGYNYLEIKYTDLDNINKTLLYGKKDQYPTNTGDVNNFLYEFGTTLDLCYDLFDYNDARNELFKMLYRYKLEYNRRSYFRSTLVDGNFKTYTSVNLNTFEKSRWIEGSSNKITKIKTTDDPYNGYDDDGNVVTLDSSKVKLLGYYTFNYPKLVYDNTRIFIESTTEYGDIPQYMNYNAIIPVPQVYVLLTNVTADIINTIISKTSAHPDQITNVIIDQALSDLSDDIRSKIQNDLSALNNIRIFIQIDSQNMSKDADTVINEIDDIYSVFQSSIDGIYLKNIKTLASDATAEDKDNYYQYYMRIKMYAHNNVYTDSNGGAVRYYVIGRMNEENVVPEYVYGKYNNPVDQIISYIGDTPTTTNQLGDSTYSPYKIAEITNEDLTALSDTDKENYLDQITKFCLGFYVTDQDNFDNLSNSLEDQQVYCEKYVDAYKSIFFTRL